MYRERTYSRYFSLGFSEASSQKDVCEYVGFTNSAHFFGSETTTPNNSQGQQIHQFQKIMFFKLSLTIFSKTWGCTPHRHDDDKPLL
jgi:hypothetical protein